MRRTNEEFRAEVFRRKDVYLKARRKRILGAFLCLPLCFILAFTGLSLSMAMQGAGDAAPGGNNAGNKYYKDDPAAGQHGRIYYITESDARFEYISEFLAEVTARGPEAGDFGWNLQEDFGHKLFVGSAGKVYYVNRSYIFDGENTFSVTEAEYQKFCDIIIFYGGKYYEK